MDEVPTTSGDPKPSAFEGAPASRVLKPLLHAVAQQALLLDHGKMAVLKV